jgi:hypothetical protein
MTTKYEHFNYRGVPYFRNGTTVCTFDQSNPITIGTYDATTESVTLHGDWKERVQSALVTFRENLNPTEREKLRETLAKPAKKSRRSTKNPTKPRKPKSVKSE